MAPLARQVPSFSHLFQQTRDAYDPALMKTLDLFFLEY